VQFADINLANKFVEALKREMPAFRIHRCCSNI